MVMSATLGALVRSAGDSSPQGGEIDVRGHDEAVAALA